MLRKKKVFVFVPALLFLTAAIWFSAPLWLTALGKCLLVDEPLQQVDILIVLSGDDEGYRLRHAFHLYRQGYAKKILLSGGTNLWKETGIDLMEKYLIQLGVSGEDILSEKYSESTVENAIFSKKVLEERGFKSATVVTSPPHTRRVSLIFKKVFPSHIRVSVCGNPEAFQLEKWWLNPSYRRMVLREYFQIAWYLLFGE